MPARAQPAPPLFLPGLMCDGRVWAAQRSALAEYAPVVVDGYGQARSLEDMATLALAMSPPRVSLVGHSMGGRIALEILRRAPSRVERLALLDTGVHPPAPGEANIRMGLLEIGRTQGIERLVDQWLPPMVHPSRHADSQLMDDLRRMAVAGGLARYEAQMTALLARSDQAPVLAGIGSRPTLVAVGCADTFSPVSQHEAIAAAIPGAELVVFPDSGHMSTVEVPDAVSNALRRWLEQPAPAAVRA